MTDSPAEPVHVLHVDDDEDFLELAAGFLQREDERFVVAAATDAGEGLDRLADSEVHCVVSDYRMPGMDGLEFLAAVREDYPELPFILFTGQGSEEIASDAISAGVTDYLRKGTGPERYALLGNRIANAVQKTRVQEQRQRHLQAIETAREGISLLDRAGRFTYVNQAYAELYGYAPEEMVGSHWEILYPEGETERVHDEILPELESAGRWRGETIGLRADGETFVEDHSLALTDDGTMVCIVREVTGRKERERELEMYEAAVEASRDGITVLDADGTYQMANGIFCEVVGLPREDIIGRDPTFLVEQGVIDESAVEAGVEKVLECLTGDSEQITFETRVESPTFGEEVVEHNLALVTADEGVGDHPGTDGAGDVAPVPVEADVGSIEGAVMTHRKVSERKRREQALRAREQELQRQNERLEEFASVVSHDLRNPLNVAMAGIDLLGEDCDSEHVARVEQAHERMDRIIADLLTLARQGESVSEVSVVESARLVRNAWDTVDTPRAGLQADWSDRIEADPGRLQQLLENLFRNAVEHGGTDATVRVGSLDGGGFYVEDDGPGIPADRRDQVTEPGYTTSEDGTGLGLNIVTDIAEAHGWDVRVTEGESGGARLEFTGVQAVERPGGGQAGTAAE